MKIGIEAQRIFRKKKHGMDIVAIELIRQLQIINTPHQFVVFVKDDEDNQVIHESENISIIRIKGGPYPYWEQVLLPAEAKRHNVDLLHCTSNTAPLSLNIPLVLTLHDIIYLEQWNFTKGSAYQITGNLYRRWNVPSAVRRSSSIITVSDFEREKIKKHFNLSDETITTIHNGVGTHFTDEINSSTLNGIQSKYNLPDLFIFFLGNTDPKKNVINVLKAMSILRAAGNLDFHLVMVDIDRQYLSSILHQVGDASLESHIRFTGYVPNHELPAIYSLATIFLYPSLRESFGIPILEAMACGTPVITSNTSSMPEVAGDAAIYVDPFSADDIAEKIRALMDSETNRNALALRGKKRSSLFSWKENATKTLQLYERVGERDERSR
jgi:glycosyltransferase involved in cell wall biosynthesis